MLALRKFADELTATLAHLLAYVGVFALLTVAGVSFVETFDLHAGVARPNRVFTPPDTTLQDPSLQDAGLPEGDDARGTTMRRTGWIEGATALRRSVATR